VEQQAEQQKEIATSEEKTEKTPKREWQRGDWQRFVDVQRKRFGLIKAKKAPLKFLMLRCAHCKAKAEAMPTTKLQYVRCTNPDCGVMVSAQTIAEAVRRWNKRGGKDYEKKC
jgi:hypothetical protein